MRLVSPLGRLSRGSPGSAGRRSSATRRARPKGCVEQLGAILDIVPHAVRLARTNHRPSTDDRRIACCGCSGWCCRRVRWRRPRSSCSRRPTCRSCARRRSTTEATIDDPRIADVRILRPQEIPMYVAEGSVRLRHHRTRLGRGDRQRRRQPRRAALQQGHTNPIQVVAAVAGDSPAQRVADLPAGRAGHQRVPEA